MTPYRERREKGFYNPKGEKPQSTTTDELSGLGAPQTVKAKAKAKKQ
jgi:hypothetical protein